MADLNTTCANCASADADSPAREDAIVESGVLGFVLEAHPDHLTPAELMAAMHPRLAGEFGSDDAVARAIDELVGAGLLRLSGGVVVPTHAAICFSRLEVG